MEHQHPLGTGNGIAPREAEQIKKLITDLTSTVEVLDADIAAEVKRPNVHCGFRFIPAGYSNLKPATVPI
jgi:hypothetical protein